MSSASNSQPSQQSSRILAVPPKIDLNQPGRLGVANVMALFNISHSTLYAGIKSGRYPKPDGYDGSKPFWKTATVRACLE